MTDSCFEFQMFFSCRYAALALSIRVFTSASDPLCSSDTAQMCKGSYIIQSFSIKCDSIGACGVVSDNLAFLFVC
ncbi:unnamed protein product [Schistosoma margrebowiei]|uniref:Uncharacterized protein n=1 Tax=Schistosoma margrebowiei TaxID=48269 RepID=A0A3P8A615_9TREM|nr:unnamed protein product [Schistosoma margrebowiei]